VRIEECAGRRLTQSLLADIVALYPITDAYTRMKEKLVTKISLLTSKREQTLSSTLNRLNQIIAFHYRGDDDIERGSLGDDQRFMEFIE